MEAIQWLFPIPLFDKLGSAQVLGASVLAERTCTQGGAHVC